MNCKIEGFTTSTQFIRSIKNIYTEARKSRRNMSGSM